MIISVVNFTRSIKDETALAAIRAINRQIREDFEPYWSLGATLRLEGKGHKPKKQKPQDMRGDAVIYLWDKVNEAGNAIGYHDKNNRGIPYGFVFTEMAEKSNEPWTVTLSHEALEMIGDPEVNLLVAGPHPKHPNRTVFHWYEMCDAVQAERYQIDGVEVSNFVLPLYFTGGEELGGRNDFLNRNKLPSFGVNPGGYIGFFDPLKRDDVTYAGDNEAKRRMAAKSELKMARRAMRYKRFEIGVGKKKA